MAKHAGEFELARGLFERALARGGDGRAWVQWARMENGLGNVEAARAVFERAVEAEPQNSQLWVRWAEVERKKRGVASARGIFVRAVNALGENAFVLQPWGLLEASIGRLDDARTLFQRAVSASPTDPYNYMAWGRLECRQARRIDRARQIYAFGVQQCESGALLMAYAQLEASEENYDLARDLFCQAREADPRDSMIWQASGVMEASDGNSERARELFERGLLAKPNDPSLWQAWGVLEERIGNIDRARYLLSKATTVDPTHGPAWAALGNLEWQLGNFEDAIHVFWRGADRVRFGSRGIEAIYLGWASLEAEMGNIARAREIFSKGLRSSPRGMRQNKLLIKWASIEFDQGQLDRAFELISMSLRYDRRDPVALHVLGRIQIRMHHLVDARKTLSKAASYAPKDLYVLVELAELEWQEFSFDGGVENASKLYERARSVLPAETKLQLSLADFEKACPPAY